MYHKKKDLTIHKIMLEFHRQPNILKYMKFSFNKPLKILLATNSLILFAGAMIGPIYALYVQKIGGDLLDASFTAGLFALVAGISVLLFGRFSDKVKENELLIVAGYLIMGIGFLLFIFVNSIFFLLIVQIILGFGEAVYSPAFDALYSKHLDGNKSGSQWGVWESMNYFTFAISAVIGGYLVTKFGFNALFAIMSLLCLASAIYIFLLPRRVL